MDSGSSFDTTTLGFGLGLFLVVCLLCYRLLQRKNYLMLILWPVIIYFCGPTLTLLFAEAPVLGKYVFADEIVAETLLMFVYFVAFLVADRLLGLSAAVRSSIHSQTMAQLARSPLFLWIYVPAAAAAAVLQLKMLREVGSVFSGVYAATGVDEGLVPYWGFLAGLYEIIFLLFVLFILSGQRSWLRVFVIAVYIVTAALRVAGGTRMILIKELAVILILFYLEGRMKRRALVIAGSTIIAVGSLIGLLRSTNAENLFGPLYGLAMESGLNALTLNVAYHVQASGYIAHHSDILDSVGFVLFSSIPKFLRFGMSTAELGSMSPYNAALNFGFDTYMPVGGTSGFATICYVSSYPFPSVVALVAVLGLLLKFTPHSTLKSIIVLVFCINAIHFWRDPIDISVKNLVQDVACALALLYVPALRSTAGTRRNTGPGVLLDKPAAG